MKNPNPQTVTVAAYESPTLKVTMVPATNITGWTLQLNIRSAFGGPALIVSTPAVVLDAVAGIFTFSLTSAQLGTVLGVGAFLYDVWRIDSGSEKRLVYGPLNIAAEQWQ